MVSFEESINIMNDEQSDNILDNGFLNYLLEIKTGPVINVEPVHQSLNIKGSNRIPPPKLKGPPQIRKHKNKTINIIKRAPRKFVPEEMKDEKYYRYRTKNNEYARISRKRARNNRIKVK